MAGGRRPLNAATFSAIAPMPLIRLAPLLTLAFALSASALDLSRKPQGGSELLPADQAFRLVSAQRTVDGVHLSWVIAPGYYLYRQRFAAESADGGAPLAALRLPKGTAKHDEHFGDVEIYTVAVEAELPVAPGQPAPTRLKLRWQGCAEAGVCYPPASRIVDVAAAP